MCYEMQNVRFDCAYCMRDMGGVCGCLLGTALSEGKSRSHNLFQILYEILMKFEFSQRFCLLRDPIKNVIDFNMLLYILKLWSGKHYLEYFCQLKTLICSV